MRVLQILARMRHAKPDAAQEALARRLPTIDLTSLGPEIAVHDDGLSPLQVPRRGMSRDGEASERLAAIAAKAVSDATCFHTPSRSAAMSAGPNSSSAAARAAASATTSRWSGAEIERPERRRFRIRGLSRAQDLQLTQWLVAFAPRRLARLMMRIWYRISTRSRRWCRCRATWCLAAGS